MYIHSELEGKTPTNFSAQLSERLLVRMRVRSKLSFIEKLQTPSSHPTGEVGVVRWIAIPEKDMKGTADPELNKKKLLDRRRRAQNPLVPIGAFVTAGVLAAGLMSFQQGDSHLGQKLMRARVIAQGVTVALMVGTAYYCGQKSANH